MAHQLPAAVYDFRPLVDPRRLLAVDESESADTGLPRSEFSYMEVPHPASLSDRINSLRCSHTRSRIRVRRSVTQPGRLAASRF